MPAPYRDADDFYREARNDLTGPLDGIRVVEVTTTVAGPRCGATLADYGADVIKIESPTAPDVIHRLPPFLVNSNPPRPFLDMAVNRNKRNATIDLQKPEGRALFIELVRRSDVVVENLRPGTLHEWGCGYSDARAVKPDIVFVSVSGYGQYGPYCQRGGYDPQAQALSGVMWMNACGDDPPLKIPIYLADELAGLHAALAALAALRHRDRRGEGQHVDVSLLDAMITSSTGLPTLAANGMPTPRFGNTFPFAAPGNVYRCQDGWVYAGVLLDTHWCKLAELLGRPELGTHPDYATIPARVARRDEVDALLGDWCSQRTRRQVADAFENAELTGAMILEPGEIVNDPHVAARCSIQSVVQPSGAQINVEAPAAKMSRTPVRLRRAAAEPGADTDAVLAELGIDAARRAELRSAGVI
jgi:formyl-CoA transferase